MNHYPSPCKYTLWKDYNDFKPPEITLKNSNKRHSHYFCARCHSNLSHCACNREHPYSYMSKVLPNLDDYDETGHYKLVLFPEPHLKRRYHYHAFDPIDNSYPHTKDEVY